MYFRQMLLASKCFWSDVVHNVIAQVDFYHARQYREDVERGNGVDAGIDVLEVVVITQCVKVTQRVDVIRMNVEDLQTTGDERIVEPQQGIR